MTIWSTTGAMLCILIITILLSSTSTLTPCHASSSEHLVILDLTTMTYAHPITPPLPSRIIGVLSDFSVEFSTLPKEFDLVALPEENTGGCVRPMLSTQLASAPNPLIVLVNRGNCSFYDKAVLAQKAGAKGLIVVNYAGDPLSTMSTTPGEPFNQTKIPVFMIDYDVGSRLINASRGNKNITNPPTNKQNARREVESIRITGVRTHSYTRSTWDASFGVMMMLAVSVVAFAAYLGASHERANLSAARTSSSSTSIQQSQPGESQIDAQYLTAQQAFGFIVLASGMLLLLFFFIRYLIYVILIVFVIGGTQSITHLGTTFLRWIRPEESRVYTFPVVGVTSIYTVLSFVLASVLSLAWLITRKSSDAWVLQDILGVSLLLVLQQTLRLPNVKVSTILLTCAFAYDIFWVFLSGYFFRESVMVAVASGGETGESIPMLLKIPRTHDELGGYSMLGLGDIALPGLFISYLLRFDYTHMTTSTTIEWKRSYFIISLLGYCVGLICTYIALVASEHGQPALLYLVPFTLGIILPLAYRRGDLSEMWHGAPTGATSGTGGATSGTTNAPSSRTKYEKVGSVNSAATGSLGGDDLESDIMNEEPDVGNEDTLAEPSQAGGAKFEIDDASGLDEEEKEMMEQL